MPLFRNEKKKAEALSKLAAVYTDLDRDLINNYIETPSEDVLVEIIESFNPLTGAFLSNFSESEYKELKDKIDVYIKKNEGEDLNSTFAKFFTENQSFISRFDKSLGILKQEGLIEKMNLIKDLFTNFADEVKKFNDYRAENAEKMPMGTTAKQPLLGKDSLDSYKKTLVNVYKGAYKELSEYICNKKIDRKLKIKLDELIKLYSSSGDRGSLDELFDIFKEYSDFVQTTFTEMTECIKEIPDSAEKDVTKISEMGKDFTKEKLSSIRESMSEFDKVIGLCDSKLEEFNSRHVEESKYRDISEIYVHFKNNIQRLINKSGLEHIFGYSEKESKEVSDILSDLKKFVSKGWEKLKETDIDDLYEYFSKQIENLKRLDEITESYYGVAKAEVDRRIKSEATKVALTNKLSHANAILLKSKLGIKDATKIEEELCAKDYDSLRADVLKKLYLYISLKEYLSEYGDKSNLVSKLNEEGEIELRKKRKPKIKPETAKKEKKSSDEEDKKPGLIIKLPALPPLHSLPGLPPLVKPEEEESTDLEEMLDTEESTKKEDKKLPKEATVESTDDLIAKITSKYKIEKPSGVLTKEPEEETPILYNGKDPEDMLKKRRAAIAAKTAKPAVPLPPAVIEPESVEMGIRIRTTPAEVPVITEIKTPTTVAEAKPSASIRPMKVVKPTAVSYVPAPELPALVAPAPVIETRPPASMAPPSGISPMPPVAVAPAVAFPGAPGSKIESPELTDITKAISAVRPPASMAPPSGISPMPPGASEIHVSGAAPIDCMGAPVEVAFTKPATYGAPTGGSIILGELKSKLAQRVSADEKSKKLSDKALTKEEFDNLFSRIGSKTITPEEYKQKITLLEETIDNQKAVTDERINASNQKQAIEKEWKAKNFVLAP